jgi:hypothetical protein
MIFTNPNIPSFPKVLGVGEDTRLIYSKTSIVEQIKSMIQIITHTVEEARLLQTGHRPVIPYYAVGLDSTQQDSLRQHLAERLFDGAFKQWAHVSAVLSGTTGQYVPVPKDLHPWVANAEARFSTCEIDFLCEFFNVAVLRPLSSGTVFMYGSTVYQYKMRYDRRLTSEWLRNTLSFDWKHHAIDFDK